MLNLAETLAQAKVHHGQGRFAEAARLYRSILVVDATHAETHYLLGTASHALGQPAEARASLLQAVQTNPQHAEAHHYLGYVLEQAGQLDEAIAHYQQAQRLKPASADIAKNLRRALAMKENGVGNALAASGQHAQAAGCFQRAIELQPDFAEAFYNFGNALVHQGQFAQATVSYRRAIDIQPDFARAYNNLAATLTEQRLLDEAILAGRRAIELKPDFVEAHVNLARILRLRHRLDEAERCCRKALQLKPEAADALNTLSLVLRDQKKPREAEVCCRRALELHPDFPRAYNNLALVLRDQQRLDEALVQMDEALQRKPDFAEAHLNRGLTLLLLGRFAEGWPEYEWRWRIAELAQPPRPVPAWDGSPLAGRTLLVHAEQGLGDTLQFIRYLPQLASAGGKVIVEVQPALIPLLMESGFRSLVPQGAAIGPYDVHASLLSLPALFRTDLASIPSGAPYLAADVALQARWRQKLDALASDGTERGFNVGIVWRGSPDMPPWRAIPLAAFETLAAVAGVRLISLQKGEGCEELAAADRFKVIDWGPQLDEEQGPFMDTAALMTQLDLVITVDTAAAHLAGGLGVPVWVALPFVPDWRWLLARGDSPWYPTMRLFRPDAPDDWAGVLQKIERALTDHIAASNQGADLAD